MKLLTSIEQALFGWPRARFLTLVFFAMFVKTGIWHIPNLLVSRRIAENPFTVPIANPVDQYLMTSWLAPFLAWLIGATGEGPYLLLHLVFSLAFTALFVVLAFTRLEETQARIAMIIFAAMPVSATVYFWLGNDSLTLLLMLAALALRDRPLAAGLIGMLLGMQHCEQAFFGFAALTVASFATPRFGGPEVYPWRAAAAALAGIILGKLALFAIFHVNGMAVTGRSGWLFAHLNWLLSIFWLRLQVILWGVLGLGWLVAIRYADRGRSTLPFFVCLAGLLSLLLIVADHTRVLAIVTFPLVYAFWLSDGDFLKGLSRTEAAMLLMVWLLVPIAWVIGGTPLWSVLPYDLVYVANKLLGWFSLPEGKVSEWPFAIFD
jgi:hypothetical protein